MNHSKWCAIIPDRGDRPQFLERCYYYLSRQTKKPDKVYLINHQTKMSPDLIHRVRVGVKRAKDEGCEYAFIIENDDFYPDTYFEELFIPGYDFYGVSETTYYNIVTREYISMTHPGHSSLCFTGFRIEAMHRFPWPHDTEVFLDTEIWLHAMRKTDSIRQIIPRNLTVGIKHGSGLCGGDGHGDGSFKYPYKDSKDQPYLRKIVGPDNLEFYKYMANEIRAGRVK